MVADLGVDFCGIKYRNPFLLASTNATRPDRWAEIAKSGWAGGIIWGGSSASGGPPLIMLYPQSEIRNVKRELSLWSCQVGGKTQSVQEGRDGVDAVKNLHSNKDPELIRNNVQEAKCSGLPVGDNLLFGPDKDTWIRGAIAAEEGGADLLELNLSCPFIKSMGVFLSRDLQMTSEIIRAVRGNTNLPIMAKLSASLLPDELKRLAVTVVESGADAISTTNLVHGFAGVDIDTGLPMATSIDIFGDLRGTVTAFCGPSIKPLALRAVAEIASVVDVPIAGIGGITNWRSAVEYMMVGATVVQVGIGAMLFGYDMVQHMLFGLQEFMEEKNYQNPRDFIGLSRRKVMGLGEDPIPTLRSGWRNVVDEALCNGCELCVKGCFATGHGAMQISDGIATIDSGLCFDCNTCRIVCPTGAIKAERI
ncbi:4Fe-4S binding protein [Chloroflexota bacterium]